jgi:hypothetical protein
MENDKWKMENEKSLGHTEIAAHLPFVIFHFPFVSVRAHFPVARQAGRGKGFMVECQGRILW